ncbi:MAG: FadR/GntR family transcriptional regulator [Bacteroidota bacterium]
MLTTQAIPLAPVARRSLPDDLARRITQLIEAEGLAAGDRLPTITELARRFGVGTPTLREALTKLETLGTVTVKHGSGVYVGERRNALFASNPVLAGAPTKKTLLDLVDTRIMVEVEAARLAAAHATPDDLAQMTSLLDHAQRHLDNGDDLSATNMAFHAAVAQASGNSVLRQVLDVLTRLFQAEQRVILDIHGSREQDHHEHVGILSALREGDENLAAERMRAHLAGVRAVLLQWDEEARPFAP